MATKTAPNFAQAGEVQPDEILSVSWDFAADMDSGETISSKAIVATDKTDSLDVTSTVVKTSSVENGDQASSKVVVVVQSMTNGRDYNIQILATISTNKVLEADIEVPCRART